MSSQAQTTSRGGVSPKSIRKLTVFFIFSLILGAIFTLHNTNPVFADMDCSNIGYNSEYLYINQNGDASYLGGTLPSSATWDKGTSTLTLNNYNGAPICFNTDYIPEHPVTINLENTNTIDLTGVDSHGYGRWSGFAAISAYRKDLIIDGNGELTIDTTENGDGIYASFLIQNGGKINIIGLSEADNHGHGTCVVEADFMAINDGEFSSNCETSLYFGLLVNDGIFKVHEVGLSEGSSCIESSYIGINGGTVDIDCGGFSAIYTNTVIPRTLILDMLDSEDVPHQRDDDSVIVELGGLYFTLPYILKASFVFNGGDVSIKGGDSDTPVIATIIDTRDVAGEQYQSQLKDEAFYFGEGVVAPSYSVETFRARDRWDEEDVLMTYFIDENSVPVNTLHIYKAFIPIPDTDTAEESEENPNTADFRLFSIISAVVVSVIAEAFIIMDLAKKVKAMHSVVAADQKSSDGSTNSTPTI